MHQESLFSQSNNNTPLANRIRPRNLEEFMGQQQLIGNGKVLRDLIEHDQVSSLI